VLQRRLRAAAEHAIVAGQTMMGEVDRILDLVRSVYPDVVCQQLQVVHPRADDDGLWFFTRPGVSNEVQVESSSGTCPFLIEHDDSDERRTANTPEEVADTIREWLAGS
jgi:hypothetical protein